MKTQQGVPSQPSNLRAVESRATSITLAWEQPSHSGDNIVSYELYWNDTFSGDVSISFSFFHYPIFSYKVKNAQEMKVYFYVYLLFGNGFIEKYRGKELGILYCLKLLIFTKCAIEFQEKLI